MKNPKNILIIALLAFSTLAVLPINPARAATGTICLQAAGTPGCPGSPTLFASSGSTLSVAVNIAGSDPLIGFDISISTDNTVLQAAGADITGSVLGGSATILLECLDGTLVQGNVCASQDGPGVLHFAAAKTGSTVTGDGLLFTATYNVLTSVAAQSLDFTVDSADCTLSSVGGGVCVSISDGTGTPVSESAVGANFSNLSDFAVDCSPASLTIPPSTDGTCTLALHSFGGFSDFIDITLFPDAGLTASTDDTTLLLPADGSVSTTLHASSAVSAPYNVLVSASADMILQGAAITHPVNVPVTVTPQDFAFSASPATLALAPGDSGTSTITVASVAGFTGTVSLSATVSPSGPTASLSPTSVVLGSSGTSTLTISVPGGTASGTYTVTVTGTGSGSHSVAITVNVGEPDFSFSALPDAVDIPRVNPTWGGASLMQLVSINNFAASISITGTISGPVPQIAQDVPGAAPTFSLSKTTSVLTSGGTDSVTVDILVTRALDGTGLSTITLTATGGGKTHTATVLVYVIDFSMSLADPVVTVFNDPLATEATPIQTVMTVYSLGSPNDTVFPGFSLFPPPPSLNPAYSWNPNSGRRILQLPSTDESRNRCFYAVYDSKGKLVTPTLNSLGQVVSFAAPMVHLNGELFGFGPTNNGCRLDGAAGQFFGGPPSADLGPSHVMPTIEILPDTPNGQYTAQVCWGSGALINCLPWTINLVPPPAQPAFNKSTGFTKHLSVSGLQTYQTFTVGVANLSPTDTVYVKVSITAFSTDGLFTKKASSSVVAIAPLTAANQIQVVMNMTGVPAGETFSFYAIILYNTAPSPLSFSSTATIGNGNKNNGSFQTVP